MAAQLLTESVPAGQPLLQSTPLTIGSVKALVEEDLEVTQQSISDWKQLADNEQIQEYLSKLSAQITIAQRLLQNPDHLNSEQVGKLITLWKCARRRDVKDYFKNISETRRSRTVSACGSEVSNPSTLSENCVGTQPPVGA